MLYDIEIHKNLTKKTSPIIQYGDPRSPGGDGDEDEFLIPVGYGDGYGDGGRIAGTRMGKAIPDIPVPLPSLTLVLFVDYNLLYINASMQLADMINDPCLSTSCVQ